MTRIGGIDAAALRDELVAADFSGVVQLTGNETELPITIALGLADRAAGLPNRPETRFGMASISKLVTGMTVARLVDAGDLAWDARYVDLVSAAVRPAALDPAVTIHDLLTHTSGFGDYFDEDGEEPYEALWTRTPSTSIRGPRDMWSLLRDLPQVAPPGAVRVYNNGGFVLVGIALEELTGRSFPEIVRSAVFERLGMADSGFWALDAVVPDLAVGYLPPAEDAAAGSPEARWRTNVYAVPAMGGPDGGVQATVADLVRLLDGLTGRGSPGGGFLSPPVRAHLLARHAAEADAFFGFGCGVLHVGDGSSYRIGHTGEDPGASARAWTYPATGERVVVASNVTDGAGSITRRIDAFLATR